LREKKSSVLIVILNWNNFELTVKCLDAVFQSDYPSYKVLVVDNGSTIDPQDILLLACPEIIYHRSSKNLGFTGGVNYGLGYAVKNGFDYIWWVNNDAIVETNCLSILVKTMAYDPSIGLASPIIKNNSFEKRTITCGGLVDLVKGQRFLAKDLEEAQNWMTLQPENICLTGTALLVRTEVVKTIGFLDDAFFAYHEDIDYCIRSSRAGFRNVIVSDAVIYHESRNVKFDQIPAHYYYYMARNELRLWKKHYHNQKKIIKRYLVWSIKKALILSRSAQNYAVAATVDGVWNALIANKSSFDRRRKAPRFLQESLISHPEFWRKLTFLLQK